MKHYTVDVSERMKAIKHTLDEHDAEESEELVRKKEALLEELIEIVENIDYARGMLLIKLCSSAETAVFCPTQPHARVVHSHALIHSQQSITDSPSSHRAQFDIWRTAEIC